MVTKEQLKKEISKLREAKRVNEKKLRIANESKREMANIGMRRRRNIIEQKNEKCRLMKELKDLKNPKSAAFKRNLKRISKQGSRDLSRSLKKIWGKLSDG